MILPLESDKIICTIKEQLSSSFASTPNSQTSNSMLDPTCCKMYINLWCSILFFSYRTIKEQHSSSFASKRNNDTNDQKEHSLPIPPLHSVVNRRLQRHYIHYLITLCTSVLRNKSDLFKYHYSSYLTKLSNHQQK